MSQPRQKDPSDPLYDANDKYNEYKVNFHANEKHFCDDHPGAPQCKVFDD